MILTYNEITIYIYGTLKNTGHDCLAAHLHRIKIFSYNYCTICKLKNTTMDKDYLPVYPELDHTSKELPKLYWDTRKLME